jgi:hypothetical protein
MTPEIIVPVDQAKEARRKIHNVLANAMLGECALEVTWMRLGGMLADFKAQEYWRKLGYPHFDAFVEELRHKFHKGRHQLFAYMSVYEVLSPYYNAEQLEKLGISKALEIKRAVKATRAALPTKVMEAALLPTTKVKELRALIGQALNLPDDRETGTWFDFGGTYFTDDERAEFTAAVKVAMLQLGIKPHVPEHIQRKEIFLSWAREFFQTWAHEVYGPQDSPGPVEPM